MAVRQSFSLVFGLEFRLQAGSGLTRVRSPTVREGKLHIWPSNGERGIAPQGRDIYGSKTGFSSRPLL